MKGAALAKGAGLYRLNDCESMRVAIDYLRNPRFYLNHREKMKNKDRYRLQISEAKLRKIVSHFSTFNDLLYSFRYI